MPKKYKREFNIYAIVNDVDDMVYIGSTTTELWHRMSQHRADARRGEKSPLYNLMREYGVEHFKITLIKKSTKENLRQDEEDVIQSIPKEKRLNFKCKSKNDHSNHFDYEKICEVYKDVKSQTKTANIIGCSVITVKKALRLYDIEIHYPPHSANRHKNKSA